jgi:hypothetical protein
MAVMKTKSGEVSAPGPDLTLVLKEIVKALIADNWLRFSSKDSKQKYYVAGASEWEAHVSGKADFDHMEFPLPSKPGTLSEWAVRSQLGEDARQGLSRQALNELTKASEHVEDLDLLLSGDAEDGGRFRFKPGVPKQERGRLLSNHMQANALGFWRRNPNRIGSRRSRRSKPNAPEALSSGAGCAVL